MQLRELKKLDDVPICVFYPCHQLPPTGICDLPTHLVGGWHDIFLRALLTDYATLKEGQHTPYLTIGPWGHMAPAVGWESLRQALAWFDAHLKDRPQQLRPLPT